MDTQIISDAIAAAVLSLRGGQTTGYPPGSMSHSVNSVALGAAAAASPGRSNPRPCHPQSQQAPSGALPAWTAAGTAVVSASASLGTVTDFSQMPVDFGPLRDRVFETAGYSQGYAGYPPGAVTQPLGVTNTVTNTQPSPSASTSTQVLRTAATDATISNAAFDLQRERQTPWSPAYTHSQSLGYSGNPPVTQYQYQDSRTTYVAPGGGTSTTQFQYQYATTSTTSQPVINATNSAANVLPRKRALQNPAYVQDAKVCWDWSKHGQAVPVPVSVWEDAGAGGGGGVGVLAGAGAGTVKEPRFSWEPQPAHQGVFEVAAVGSVAALGTSTGPMAPPAPAPAAAPIKKDHPSTSRAPKVKEPVKDESSEDDADADKTRCEDCKKGLRDEAALVKHRKKRHPDLPAYQCPDCGKCWKNSAALVRHSRIHTGEKPFKCTECDSTFSQKHHLQIHVRKHTGQKPFVCSECSTAFSDKSNLRAHMKIHTGEKPFSCFQCGAGFTCKSHLVVHIRRHLGEKPYPCPNCKKSFVIKADCDKHQLVHTDRSERKGQSRAHAVRKKRAAKKKTATAKKKLSAKLKKLAALPRTRFVAPKKIYLPPPRKRPSRSTLGYSLALEDLMKLQQPSRKAMSSSESEEDSEDEMCQLEPEILVKSEPEPPTVTPTLTTELEDRLHGETPDETAGPAPGPEQNSKSKLPKKSPRFAAQSNCSETRDAPPEPCNSSLGMEDPFRAQTTSEPVNFVSEMGVRIKAEIPDKSPYKGKDLA